MKRIVINEMHIRQLVKETLENLILGEDEINNEIYSYEEIEEILQNANLKRVECLREADSFAYERIAYLHFSIKSNDEDFDIIDIYANVRLNITDGEMIFKQTYDHEAEYEDSILNSWDIVKLDKNEDQKKTTSVLVNLELVNRKTERYFNGTISENVIPENIYKEIDEEINANWETYF